MNTWNLRSAGRPLSKDTMLARLRGMSPLLKDLIFPRMGRLVGGLLLLLTGRAFGLALPASTRYLVDEVIVKHKTNLLAPLVIFLIVSVLIQSSCSLAVSRIASKEGHSMVAWLRRRAYEHAVGCPVAFYDSRKTGELVHRIVIDTDSVRNLLGLTLIDFIGGLLTAAYALVLLLQINVPLTLAVLCCVIGFSLASKKGLSETRQMFTEASQIQGQIMGRLTEALGGVRVIKGYHAEAQEVHRFSASVEHLLKVNIQIVRKTSSSRFITSFAAGFVVAGSFYLGASQIFSGNLTLGGLVAFAAFISFLTAPMSQLTTVGTTLVDAVARLERVQQLLHEKSENDNPRRTKQIGRIQGVISFESVYFGYRPGKLVLHDITFAAIPGTTTALIGPSGSGKTTITSIVAAFYEPSQGVVRVDGVDLATISLGSYRTQLGMVLQDVFLFDGTVRENVLFARPQASEEEFRRACILAHVAEFVERLPNGYETPVGERGVKLSGGERQRISIARAILVDPRILILDEATSNLDSESESAIRKGLAYLLKGRTTFVIAHRLSTIQNADQILVVEKGRIVERGTHERLSADHGRYYDLFTKQMAPETGLSTSQRG